MKNKIARLKKHFILCGYGRVGEAIALTFNEEGTPFVIISKDEEHVAKAEKEGYLAILGDATDDDALLQHLANELLFLQAAPPDKVETTLLIHPKVLTDFLDFNDFLEAVDATLEAMHMQGDLQVASFHPDYQFDGSAPDDITNYSNRSPYPTLHLLRESSIEGAVATMADTDAIYEANIATLEKLGIEGWRKLGLKS